MDTSLVQSYLDAVAEKLDAEQLLHKIGYATDKIQPGAESVKAFCPIHRDTRFRSLLIDRQKRTFKCTIKTCDGFHGGGLVDLFAKARKVEALDAAAELVGAFDLDIDRSWLGRIAADLHSAAEKHFVARDHAAAEDCIQRALKFQPDLLEARLLLADILAQSGHPDRAAQELAAIAESYLASSNFAEADQVLQRAGEMFPASEDVLLLKVRSAESQDRGGEAFALLEDVARQREVMGQLSANIGIYEKMIKLRPDDPGLHIKLGNAREELHDIRTACRSYESAIDLLAAQQRAPEAIELAEKVLGFLPENTRLRGQLVDLLLHEGEYERAKGPFFDVVNALLENSDYVGAAQTAQRWLDVEPDSTEAHETLARIYQEEGELEQAAGELRAAAEICDRQGRPERALELLARVKFLVPEDIDVRRDLAARLAAAGEGTRAGFEYLDIAAFLFQADDRKGADAALAEAQTVADSAEFLLQLASSCQMHGLEARAQEVLERAAARSEESGDAATAIACLERLIEARPDEPALHLRRAAMMWNVGSPEDAVRTTIQVVGHAVEHGWTEGAVQLLQQAAAQPIADAADLLALFGMALQVNENTAAAHFYNAYAEGHREANPSAVLEAARQISERLPEWEVPIQDIAEICTRLEDAPGAAEAYDRLSRFAEEKESLETAVTYLDVALNLHPEGLPLLRRKVDLLIRLHRMEDARTAHRDYLARMRGTAEPEVLITEFEAFLRHSPADFELRRELADLLYEAGRTGDAAGQYDLLLAEAETTGNLVNAASIRERLVQIQPHDVELKAALGRDLLHLGETERGVPILTAAAEAFLAGMRFDEAAAAAREVTSAAHDHLQAWVVRAEAERALGHTDEALLSYDTLVDGWRAQGSNAEALAYARRRTELSPENPAYLRDAADLAEESGFAEEASQYLSQLLPRLPKKTKPAEMLALAERILNLDPFSIEGLERRYELASHLRDEESRFTAVRSLAEALALRGDTGRAVELAREAAQMRPKEVALGRLLVTLAQSVEDSTARVPLLLEGALIFEAAASEQDMVGALRDVLASDSASVPAHEMLVRYYDANGDIQGAFPHRLALLEQELRTGKPKQWQARLKEMRQMYAGEVRLRLALVRVLLAGGHRDDALPELEAIAQDAVTAADYDLALEAADAETGGDTQSWPLRFAKAEALKQLGRIVESILFIRECISDAVEQQRYADAERFARLWLDMVPEEFDGLEQLAEIYKLQQRTQRAVETLLELAAALRNAREHDRAVTVLRRVLEMQPDALAARTLLWQALLDLNQTAEAITEMEQLADLHIDRREYKEAATVLSRILDYRTQSADTLRRLASLVHEYEDFGKALPYFRKLLALRREQSSVDEVCAEYEGVLRLEGADVSLRVEYAEYLESLGRHADCKAQLIQAAQVYRDELNDPVKAVQYLGRATSIQPSRDDARIFEELANLHQAIGAPQFAVEALREAVRLYTAASQPAKALDALERLTELPGALCEDFAELGGCYEREGEKAKAEVAYSSALRMAEEGSAALDIRRTLAAQLHALNPLNLEAALFVLRSGEHQNRGAAALSAAKPFLAARRSVDARAILEEGVRQAPRDPAVRRELAELLRTAGEREALRGHLLELGFLVAEQGSTADALAIVEEIAALPANEDSSLRLAALLLTCGETERAVATYCNAAEYLVTQGRMTEAAQALNEGLRLDAAAMPVTQVASLYRNCGGQEDLRVPVLGALDAALMGRSRTRALLLGTALLEQAGADEVRGLLERINSKAGAAFTVSIGGAFVDWLLERDRADESQQALEHIVSISANSPDAWSLASIIYRKLNLAEKAAGASIKAAQLYNAAGAVTEEEHAYKAALEVYPDDKPTLETLAFFYERERRIEDAVEVITRLVALLEKEQDLLGACGWLRRLLGLKPEEVALRQKLISHLISQGMQPEALDELQELARLFGTWGDRASEAACLERVLSIEPRHEVSLKRLLEIAESAGQSERIERYSMELAELHAEAGQYDEACALAAKVAEAQPGNTAALRKLAFLYRRAGRAQDAAATLVTIGDRLLEAGDSEGAADQFEAAAGECPDSLGALGRLVAVYSRMGNAEQALAYAGRALDVACAADQPDALRDAAQQLLDLDPENAAAHRELGHAHAALGRPAEAIAEYFRAAERFHADHAHTDAADCLERVLSIAPANIAARKKLADLFVSAGDYERAETQYFGLIDAYIEAGEMTNAEATLGRIMQLNPESSAPHEKALAFYQMSGQKARILDEINWLLRHHMEHRAYDTAEALVEQGLELDPENFELQELRVDVIRRMGRIDEVQVRLREMSQRYLAQNNPRNAARVLEKLLEQEPGLLDVRRELAEVYMVLNDEGRALDEYCAVVSALLESGETEAAREAAEQVIERNPSGVSARSRLAELFSAAGLREIAAKHYYACAGLAQKDADAGAQIYYLSLAAESRPKWPDPVRDLAEAAAFAGRVDDAIAAWVRLETLYMEAKQFTEAAAALHRACTLAPKDAELLKRLAALYGRLGEKENRANALEQIGNLLASTGQVDEAVEAYGEALNLKPGNVPLLLRYTELFVQVGNELEIIDKYLQLADGLTRRGAFVEATSVYEKIIAIDRRNKSAREKFVGFLRNLGQKARAVAELNRLAELYLAEEEIGEALRVLNQARALNPQDPETLLTLAKAYEGAGDPKTARDMLEKASVAMRESSTSRAIDVYRRLLEANPSDVEFRTKYTEELVRLGQLEEAAESARKLAEIYSSRGEYDLAERSYMQAADIAPLSPETLRDAVQEHSYDPMLQYLDYMQLGRALADAGDVQQALEAYTRARELNDDKPELIERYLEALLQVAPESEAILDYLTLAERYAALENWAAALDYYERVLRLDPGSGKAAAGRDTAAAALEARKQHPAADLDSDVDLH